MSKLTVRRSYLASLRGIRYYTYRVHYTEANRKVSGFATKINAGQPLDWFQKQSRKKKHQQQN